jgi:hypothetical protein
METGRSGRSGEIENREIWEIGEMENREIREIGEMENREIREIGEIRKGAQQEKMGEPIFAFSLISLISLSSHTEGL